MEDFQGIADESFPSFLTNSLLGGNSEILENVTLSSNLGLPVAVSTLARNRSSTDNRNSDVQASYLVEGKFSVPSESSPSSQSEAEPKERLQLVFPDDDSISKRKNQTEGRHLSGAVLKESTFQSDRERTEEEHVRAAKPFQNQEPSDGISPLEQEQDSPVDFCSRSWMNKENKVVVPDAGKHFEERNPNNDLSHTSFLENEKLMSLASLEDSSDDDIDDEEFYDDHLEAYFEQLAIPGMMYEGLEGQESPENYFKLPANDPSQGSGREEVLVKTLRAANVKFNPVYFHDTNASKGDFGLIDPLKLDAGSPHQNKHLASDSETVLPVDRFLDTEMPQVSIQKNVDVASLKSVSDNEFNSADALWSPTSERQTCECYESVGKSKDQMDLSQSVVYQNEEGRWVTDLAYYTAFDKEQDVNVSLSDEMNEDFRSGSDALDLIAQDEEEFNKEHQFMQEENIDAQSTSVALEDTSWGTSVNYGLLRRSLSTSDLDKDDATYLRLSLGEFFAQRSEALGCLGGGYNVKRPSFGYFIRSPEKREPVALIRKSDVSRSNLEREMAHLNYGLFSGDLKAQLSEGSVTLQAEELESISQVDENDVTLTANKGKTEDTFLINSKPQRRTGEMPSGGDSVLRISTIASAIADASVNADPSQLVAMIKALSNKTREKTSQGDDLKNPSPECGGHDSEDDQDSFRPSTSPLSHSSPSEISGNSLSGCALESFSSAAHLQKHPCERESSQLTCPQASISRLTYMSEQESTCPATASDRGLKDHQSDVTSALSTTIIQASPVPSQERASDKLREKSPFQSRGKGVLPYIIQKNLDTEKETETTSLSSQLEDVKPNFRSRRELSSKSEDLSETTVAGVTSNPSELDQVSLALPGELGLGQWALLATPRLPMSRQGPVPDSGRVTPVDTSAANSAFIGQGPPQTLPNTEGCGPAPSRQHVPTSGPVLSARCPLPMAPCAQPSSGALPRCQASGATVCGLPGTCHPAVATGEHIQNSVAMGLCLGQNISSGLMAASSLCNPYSNAFNQSLLSTAKPFTVQSLGPNCGIDPWDSGVMSGFGKVRVPEELKFPHACCIGIASQTYLSVLNPADRWLQVSIGVLSVSVNGEKVDLSAYPCLVFKNKVIIRPHATEEIKVLFIPSDPGIFRCIFSIASWPFSADAETVAQAEALASRVVLTAIAETPVIEVETEKKDVLDFGDLTYGSWKALPLKLVNKTHANIPIRLIISANAIAWRCFTFSKEPIHAALKAVPYAHAIAQLAAPSVINHMMPASDDGQDPEFLIIWVLFHSPKKQMTSSEILDSAEEFLARVDIEVDSPNPTPVIKSISLRARTGIARIHAPKDLQTMHLFASVASSTRQYLPLKNAGNIDVHLDIKIPDQGSHFSVDPEKLFLKPGEEHEVIVSFSPKDPKACEERILKIFVQSFGPQYEVMLKGEVVSSGNKPLMPASCCSDIPSILSNKQFLAWGGVPLGRTHNIHGGKPHLRCVIVSRLQKLALRNNSTSSAQHLRLLIRGQDQDCFQFQHTFGSEERLTSNCEIRIRPKEDIYISVLFAPTRLSCMLAKLEIKQLGIRSQPGFKFTIPLSGYGGTSNLILEDVKKLSDSYMVTVNDLVPGKESRIVFSVRNTGSRAAFIKAVGFKDSQKKVLLNPRVLRIFPDKFVLKERTQEDVTIIYNPSDRENNCKNTTELSTIYFFGGDEISRQQYRRAMLHTPGVREQVLPTQSMLQNIDFAEAFQDELLITEVYDLPQRPNDVQLFYGNMRKIILSVIGEFRDSVSNREFLPPSSRPSLESKSESGSCGTHGGNISLDVLPVKGPQGSPLLSQAVRLPQDKSALEEVWAVQPEHLILVAPSCDMAKTGRFQILNNSVRLLKFELYWPAHCLTVTPQHGFIAPESKLQILVSPNSSLSTKHSMFPWSGLIYVHCDNGQKKVVKVQIREDLTQEELFTCLTSSPFGILSPETEPSVNHLVKPVTKPPSTRVEIRNKTVTFPTTEPGETSGSYLELENHGDMEVRWHLSSLAPPYVKGVDESGDVFRATYAAFRCSPISGVLESHGVQKVSITFLPRDRGDYAQFWDVECHPLKEPHLKHTLRFQLSGHSVKAELELENSRISTNSLIKIDNLLKPRRQPVSKASALIPGRQLDLTHRGVYAPEDVYQFLPTRVGESRTLKVNLRNNSFITHLLKFLSPREPFYVKHSKYSLRAQHYINMPVQFKPRSVGKFEALLVVQTDEGKSVAVRLIGEALGKS
nr:centrosomal protein of 192 kDa isoform X3 [Kogia breviceps]